LYQCRRAIFKGFDAIGAAAGAPLLAGGIAAPLFVLCPDAGVMEKTERNDRRASVELMIRFQFMIRPPGKLTNTSLRDEEKFRATILCLSRMWAIMTEIGRVVNKNVI